MHLGNDVQWFPAAITMLSMTIGIGILCENEKSVVMAADRFVVVGDSTVGLQYEGESRKIFRLSDKVLVVGSGGQSEIASILNDPSLLAGDGSIRQLAEKVRENREALRKAMIENQYLKRILGTDWAAFNEACKSANGQLYKDMYVSIVQFKLGLSFLIAGLDQEGAHLFLVDDGTHVPVNGNTSGFGMVGSGALQAQVAIARRGFKKTQSLSAAVFSAYEAKRASEFAYGVGKQTDIAIIRPNTPAAFLSQEAIAGLSRIYDRLKPPGLSKADQGKIDALLAKTEQ